MLIGNPENSKYVELVPDGNWSNSRSGDGFGDERKWVGYGIVGVIAVLAFQAAIT